MEAQRVLPPGHWTEPAHPTLVKNYDDLINIYRVIREKYQTEIDKAFDSVARQIGFVVTTTIPVVAHVEAGGAVKTSVDAAHLKGTLFEAVVKPLAEMRSLPAQPGQYHFYLLWFDALRLKLRADWMEPAHFFRQNLAYQARAQATATQVKPGPGPQEPAHWFDPGLAIAAEEAILISAIDEVYPELRLASQISAYREILRSGVRPEVMEPAHFQRPNLPTQKQ